MANEIIFRMSMPAMDNDVLLDLFAYALTVNTDKKSMDEIRAELERRNIHPEH
jgi:hypothetical protein